MTPSDWSPLVPLVKASRMAAETRLAEWQRREAKIMAAIARLDGPIAVELGGDDVLRRAGADLRWQAWCDARRTALSAELAQVRYRRVAAEEAMRHAAARDIALGDVARTALRDRARTLAMRAEREGNA
jgi:hypothetical protein